MVARFVLNKAHVYSEVEQAEFLQSAEKTAAKINSGSVKLSDEARTLLRERDACHETDG